MTEDISIEEKLKDLRDFYSMGNEGWEVVEDNIGLYVISPEAVRFSKKQLTDPKGLKFGDYDSILRLEAARFYYLHDKYEF